MQSPVDGQKNIDWFSFPLLLLLWAIVQGILVYHFGIIDKDEAVKYIQEAAWWDQHHQFSQPKYLFYSTYIALQFVSLKTGTGVIGAYIIQLLTGLYALFLFHKTALQLFQSEKAARLAGLFFVACIPIQTWTVHLYTESLFISLVIIFMYFFLKKNKDQRDNLRLGVIFLLLIFCRPTGILFIMILMLWFFANWISRRQWLRLSAATVIFLSAFGLLLNYAMKGEGEFDFMKPFVEEHVICGVSTGSNSAILLPKDGNSIQGILYYVANNPGHFIRLSIKKLGAFFGLTRSYYSTWHNLYLGFYFYPLYLLALLAVFTYRAHRRFMIFACSSIIVFAVSVALTCDDWLNRFIMPVLPCIILLATTGITILWPRLRSQKAATG